MTKQYIILFVLLAVTIVTSLPVVKAQDTCQSFHIFDVSMVAVNSQKCQSFENSTCCDFGTATRALNWASEDDGCGILTNPRCQQLINELSCHYSCAPNMYIDSSPKYLVQRPTVCLSWIQETYNACKNDSPWCAGLNGNQLSTCSFLQQISSRYGNYARLVNAKSTCTYISDLTVREFGEKILSVNVATGDTNCNAPISQPIQHNTGNSIGPFTFVTLLCVLFSILSA